MIFWFDVQLIAYSRIEYDTAISLSPLSLTHALSYGSPLIALDFSATQVILYAKLEYHLNEGIMWVNNGGRQPNLMHSVDAFYHAQF